MTTNKLTVAVSTLDDGNMLTHANKLDPSVIDNRINFLAKNNLNSNETFRVNVIYQGDDYCRYLDISNFDSGEGLTGDNLPACDALITTRTDQTLSLSLADCAGVIIYDKVRDILMLTHLGRHSLEQQGATKSLQYLIKNYNCAVNDLVIIFSPSAGNTNYPLYKLGGRSIQDVAINDFMNLGIKEQNIDKSLVDTTTNKNYFSHSEYKKGHRDSDGRFIIAVKIN